MSRDIEIRNALIARVVTALANEHYGEALEIAANSRVSEIGLRTAVLDYGCKLAPLPKEEWHRIDYIEISDSHPGAWSVVVPMFTVEEGLSDLSLELTLIEDGSGSFEIEIDDLHVL